MYLDFNYNNLDEMLSSFAFAEFMRNTIQKINKVGNFINIKYFINEEEDNEVCGIVIFNKKDDDKKIFGRYWVLNKTNGHVYFQDIKKADEISDKDKKVKLRSPESFIFV